MTSHKFASIFKQGSKTYFTSSIFFPQHIKDDVYTFYAFVRVADDYVDSIPQQTKEYRKYVRNLSQSWKGMPSGNVIIDDFVALARRKHIAKADIDSFLAAMESDISVRTYQSLKQLETYMYGSAEVIGLIMARILNLPADAQRYARLLGKSMQYLNFIRDIHEDNTLGRIYFPKTDLEKFQLRSLEYDYVRKHPEQFKAFMKYQVERYFSWQRSAEKGFSAIPIRYRIAIQTASEMYKWTARVIYNDPFIIYRKKVKPSSVRIIICALFQTIKIYTGMGV